MFWFQILCQKFSKVFLSKVINTVIFKIRKFKVDYPFGNRLKKMLTEKAYQQCWTLVVKKKQIEKMKFKVQKYDKDLKSKNDLKRPLGALINELWRIYVFWKLVNFWKPCSNRENGIEIHSEISSRLPTRRTVDKLVKFFKKCISKKYIFIWKNMKNT